MGIGWAIKKDWTEKRRKNKLADLCQKRKRKDENTC